MPGAWQADWSGGGGASLMCVAVSSVWAGGGHGLLSSSKLAWAHELGGRRISTIKRGQVIYLDSDHLQKYKNIFLW